MAPSIFVGSLGMIATRPKMASARARLAATKVAFAAAALSSDFAILSLSPGGAIASANVMASIAKAALPNSSGVKPEAWKISTVFGHFALMTLPQASPVRFGLSLIPLIPATSSALAAASLLILLRNFSILSRSSVFRGIAPATLSSFSGASARVVGAAVKPNRAITASVAAIEAIARRGTKSVVCLGDDAGFILR